MPRVQFQSLNHGFIYTTIMTIYPLEALLTLLKSGSRGKQAENIATLLLKYEFDGSKLYYREKAQKYKNVVEIVRPDVLIEDDCKSIGGSWQMCITDVDPQIKDTIKFIVVKEFKGIDHLPHDMQKL